MERRKEKGLGRVPRDNGLGREGTMGSGEVREGLEEEKVLRGGWQRGQ